ncbi:MAG TPA: DHCW motif cupin fold protein [Candidatus Dormibacteraeota bacterium]|nr:DHCW motif cupin fold protein [Candidatus Dormibacteraeota bacterium]
MTLPLESDFTTCDWHAVAETEHLGERGVAYWKTRQFGDVRVRMVRYTPGYLADHWCERGHVLLVLEGALTTELADGRTVELLPGMSYTVRDGAMAHRSRTDAGAHLFIVD